LPRCAQSENQRKLLWLLNSHLVRKQRVEVTDLESNSKTEYHAIRAAAKALGLDKRYIENFIYLNQTTPVLDTP
jgi:hypothetical protein